MDAARETPVWRVAVEHVELPIRGGGVLSASWLTLPGWLELSGTIDCEAVFGADWSEQVLELLLPADRWWFWWTEAEPLERLAREAPLVQRFRRLPNEWPQDDREVWIGRGVLRRWGAAIIPPNATLQASVRRHGPSQYSEFDPNFVVALAAPRISPEALRRWCREASPHQPGLELLEGTAQRLLMQWNGELRCGLHRNDERLLLASLAGWAEALGSRLECG